MYIFEIDAEYARLKRMNISLRRRTFPDTSQYLMSLQQSAYATETSLKQRAYDAAIRMKSAYNTIFSAAVEYLAPHLGDNVVPPHSAYAVDEFLFSEWATRYVQHYAIPGNQKNKFTHDIVMERIRMHACVRLKSMFAMYFYQTDEHTAQARMEDLALFIEGVDTAF